MQKIVTSLAALFALVIAMAIGGFPTVIAQEIRESAPPAVEEMASEELDIPEDQFDRGTPRRTTEGFIAAVDAGDFEKAANYLDLRNLRGEATEYTGAQLARRLYVISKRGEWTEVGDFIDDPAGRAADGLPDYRDSIGFVKHEGEDVQLFLQLVPRGDGVSIWKVSNASVSLIPDLYETYGYSESVEDLRRVLPQVSFLGFELFKWILLVGVGILTYITVFLIALLVRRMLGDPQSPSHRQIFRFLAVPGAIGVMVLVMNLTADSLGRGATAETIGEMSPIPILVTVWVMFSGLNLIFEIYSDRLYQNNRPGAVVLLRPAANAIKLLVALGAVLLWLDNIGVNITTLLAGLGVGGVAVALALQKPMEDVFGAVTLYSQQPIRIGDFCRVGTVLGTIEEIGLRTTRLRTLNDTVIAVPNSKIASEPIDNISARQKIRYRPTLRLRYDTTPEQLQQILEGIRELLSSHERVLEDSRRVRFKEFGDDALKIEVNAYLNTTEWGEYLRLAEELNIRIMEIIARAGTSLALPSQVLHVEQTPTSS
jgi:MscS family membrane protein